MTGFPRAAVVLLAAGEGRRVGAATNKVLLPLAGRPVFAWSLRTVRRLEYVERVVVVVRDEDRDVVTTVLEHELHGTPADPPVQLVAGGSTRHGSEWNALRTLAASVDDGSTEVVAIHDAARPLASAELFSAVVRTADSQGGALPVRAVPGLLPRSPNRPEREALVAVQTPQAFRAAPLLEAYRAAERDGFVGTDTASCVERFTDLQIGCVPCPATNLKITFPEDVAVAERLLVDALGR